MTLATGCGHRVPDHNVVVTNHEQFTTMLNVFERNLVSEESVAISLARVRTRLTREK